MICNNLFEYLLQFFLMQRGNQSDIYQLKTLNSDSIFESIRRSIEDLDRQNMKLVSIADSILKTSFIKNTQPVPAVILQIEQTMRASFNALIQNVREFFIDIDQKLKNIGLALEDGLKQSGRYGVIKQKIQTQRRQEPSQMDLVVNRISALQENLKRTQQNETKLINIIEEMALKNYREEQPTIIKSSQVGGLQNSKTLSNFKHQTSFRLFSLHDSVIQKNRPYSIIQSQVSESLNIRRKDNPQTVNFCMPAKQPSTKSIALPKRSLKNQGSQFQIENSNRIHRLSYMMNVLKQ